MPVAPMFLAYIGISGATMPSPSIDVKTDPKRTLKILFLIIYDNPETEVAPFRDYLVSYFLALVIALGFLFARWPYQVLFANC